MVQQQCPAAGGGTALRRSLTCCMVALQIFFNGEFVGGCDILMEMHKSGEHLGGEGTGKG